MQQPEIAIILNPGSGSTDEEFNTKVREALRASGRAFICLETHPEEGAAPAIKEAADKGVSTVVVCGGDGTVMSAVNALGKMETDLRLAIVPGGTANLLARALGVPLDVEGAMSVALEGDERRIDMGVCGDTLFALGLGLGLTEKLVSKSSSEEKEKLGKWAYVKSMLEEIGAQPTTFTYTLDDGQEQETKGVAVVVANAGTLSGRVEFAPGAKMDDGKLDLVILHQLKVLDLGRLLWKSVFGDLKEDRVLTCLAGKNIHIECNPPLDLQIDGETVETRPPLQIEVRPGALRVAVPSEEQKASFTQKLAEAVTGESGKTARPKWWYLAPVGAFALIGTLIWTLSKGKNK